jgi:peptidoglycan/LPS O-acetylase OafA/YrhL
MSFSDVFNRIPFATCSAALFYFITLLLIASSRLRQRAYELIEIPTPSTNEFLLPLDSFRGFAALWVSLFHFWQWSVPAFQPAIDLIPAMQVGMLGVPIFGVLSGFLIYRSVRKIDSAEHIKSYAIRRFLRVYPLYLFTVVAMVIIMRPPFEEIVSEAFMLATIGSPIMYNPPAWSLYVEILFYCIMPVLAMTFRGHTWKVAILAFLVLQTGVVSNSQVLALWKYFFVGVLCSELLDRIGNRRSNLIGGFAFLIGVALLALAIWSTVHHPWGLSRLMSQGALAASLTLLILGTTTSPILTMLLSFKPLRCAGIVSYSIYLWHPFLIYADFPIAFGSNGNPIALSKIDFSLPAWTMFFLVAPALLFWSTASYLLIEKSFLRLRHRLR